MPSRKEFEKCLKNLSQECILSDSNYELILLNPKYDIFLQTLKIFCIFYFVHHTKSESKCTLHFITVKQIYSPSMYSNCVLHQELEYFLEYTCTVAIVEIQFTLQKMSPLYCANGPKYYKMKENMRSMALKIRDLFILVFHFFYVLQCMIYGIFTPSPDHQINSMII